MDEIRDRRSGNMTMRQLSKSEVLRKLQENSSIYFEKSLPASSVNRGLDQPRLVLPAWFVREHGGKLLESVVLRSQSSLTTWTVGLVIEVRKSATTGTTGIVRMSTGWGAFVSFNGLLEGDSLVFALTAMSEFEVYLFREDSRSPDKCPSLAIGECSNDSERARKKARPSPERRDEQFVPEVKIRGSANSTSLIAKKKTVGLPEEFPAFTSNQSPTSYSNDLHLHESKNNRVCTSGGRPDLRRRHRPAISRDKLDMMSRIDTKDGPTRQFNAGVEEENEYQESSFAETGQNRQFPHFLKKLSVTSILGPERGSCMEIPAKFWKTYSRRLRSVIKLQGIREDSTVRSVVCRLLFQRKQTRLCLGIGWDTFAAENNLKVGQDLIFTLTGDSFFVVRKGCGYWVPST